MTAYTRVSVGITDAADLPTARLGGTDKNIPVISFTPDYSPGEVEVQLNTDCLTPAEQVAWLLDLASKAQALAVQVQERNVAAVTA